MLVTRREQALMILPSSEPNELQYQPASKNVPTCITVAQLLQE